MARSRYRSVTYDFEASLEVARAVVRVGGRTDAATLAGLLSYSGVRNGAFLTRLANARLFGLVTGRSGEVIVSARGARCLSGNPEEAARARAESCLDVPLFRLALERYAGQELPPLAALAETLQSEFGEAPDKASAVGRTLIASARQAGLVRDGVVDLSLVRGGFTEFTDSEKDPGRAFAPRVRSSVRSVFSPAERRRQVRTGNGGHAMATKRSRNRATSQGSDEQGLWIDGPAADSPRRTDWRRAGIVAAAAATLVVVGLPVGLLVTSGAPSPTAPRTPHRDALRLGHGPAEQSVLSALSATTDSGSFAFSYRLAESPGTSTTPTTSSSCVAEPGAPVVPCSPSAPEDNLVQGNGTINADPMAMAASASISSGGVTGLQVGVRVDPTTVWEVSNTDNGLTPQMNDGAGQSLSGFAGLTEGTLGQREGAVAMMGMASPTGYLDLEQPAISAAAAVGPSTVDGVAVTQYELAIDPAALASAPGVSSEEADTINAAIAVLTAQGYTNIRDLVSIDASGFIRESSSTVSFSDGGTVTLDASFSDFGCAGTVLMPGDSATSSPPANCSSPDTGVAPTTTTTTATTTTASPAVTPTTVSGQSGAPTTTSSPTTSTSSNSSTTATTTSPSASG